jgi:hypothetical protein
VFRFTPRTRLVIVLLCAALLASRIAGAHLHLCLDGSEPPVALHVADGGEHHAENSGESHADQDVTLGGDYLSKKSGQVDPGLLALCLALLLFFLPRLRAGIPDHLAPARPRAARINGLPPTRGPPRRA